MFLIIYKLNKCSDVHINLVMRHVNHRITRDLDIHSPVPSNCITIVVQTSINQAYVRAAARDHKGRSPL